jgi:hypothetical protein
MESLKTCIRNYRDVDNKLRDLNSRVYDLRQERRSLEIELSDIVKQSQFDEVSELRINDDNSSIKIQRPGWKKPWGLSKKDLGEHLLAYFKDAGPTANASDCMLFIVQEQNKKLVSEEFSFNRVVRDE